MYKAIVHFFDKLEDQVRYHLSHRPMVYAWIGGIAIVLFWRGIWDLADMYGMTPWTSVIVSIVIMMATGTFVSFFIGERLLMSGLKEEKRLDQRTEEDLEKEEAHTQRIFEEIEEMRKMIYEIHEELHQHPKKRHPAKTAKKEKK